MEQRDMGQVPVLDKALRLAGQVSPLELLTAINLQDGQIRDSLSRSVAQAGN